LEKLMRERTVLIIAHRYNTIAAADRVAVLEDGQLVEVGDASMLLRSAAQYGGLLNTARKEQYAL
jgi:ATP-binding cassette subfamily B protein